MKLREICEVIRVQAHPPQVRFAAKVMQIKQVFRRFAFRK